MVFIQMKANHLACLINLLKLFEAQFSRRMEYSSSCFGDHFSQFLFLQVFRGVFLTWVILDSRLRKAHKTSAAAVKEARSPLYNLMTASADSST